ncbi:MAG: hypothetical protein IMY82_09095 [Chloroflexi bacterium]|nr:hypothetical protein [Chloroflexota bacterium]
MSGHLQRVRSFTVLISANQVFYCYPGNLAEEVTTHCSHCAKLLIRHSGYRFVANSIGGNGCCPECSEPIAGVGMSG